MKKTLYLLLTFALLYGCKKSETYITLWENSFGAGAAKFIKVDSDLGIVVCGVSEGKPYLARLDKDKVVVTEISAETNGVFTSVLLDMSGYIVGGSSEGKMLIMRFSETGNKLWEKSIETSFKIERTRLLKISDNNFLAIGSAEPDAVYDAASGILFEVFDSTGQELNKQEYTIGGHFLACNEAAIDNSGCIYLALTRKNAHTKSKASVAKFSSELNRLWEQDLANNPAYGASSLAIAYNEDNVFVGGKTELLKEGGLIDNSFIACLSSDGDLKWRKYPENSNSGVSIAINSIGEVNLLNINCFVVNVLSASTGNDNRRIRLYDVCEPATTDAFASDFDIDSNNNLVMAGSREGMFYVAVKN